MIMSDHLANIKEGMEVIGADGVHVGIVDHTTHHRIKLTRGDSADGEHHFISVGLVAEVEGDKVRLSASGANVQLLREEEAD